MKTTLVLWGALVLLSPSGLAQEGSAPLPVREGSKALPEGDLSTFENLHRQFVEAKVRFSEKLKQLRTTDRYREALKKRDMKTLRALMAEVPRPEKSVLPGFLEQAKQVEGSEEEAKILFYVLSNSGRERELSKKAFERLAARHFKSKDWGPVLRALPWILPKDRAKAFIARLAKESPHAEIRLMAQYVAATSTLRNRKASKEEKAEARKILDEIKTKHPDSLPGLSLNGPKFIQEHLQVGMKAPEIVGHDVYGKPMKLSDFAGRVVVIDFWGDW